MADDRKVHIVMFPWLAFGHIIPYLELSKLIAKKGHKVSFVSTPRNIDRLPKQPPNLVHHLKFVKIPLPLIENLPENAEATIDLPYNKVKYLKLACDALQQPITEFLQRTCPDWILYDFPPYWIPSIASKLNIHTAYFSIFTAAFLGFLGPTEVLKGDEDGRKTPEDFIVKPKWVPFETNVAFKLFEILRIFDSIEGDEENISDTWRVGAAIENCDVLAVRSCSEFEPKWLKVLEEIYQKPVVPVGQLPTTGNNDDGDEEKDEAWRFMKEWLDKQAKGSAVYVAFGSEAKPSQAELNEISLGLELSGLPYFWVLRKKRGGEDTEVILLPEGFENRTKDRGVVCTSWAPQLKILSHESVGGFLTHSGWSSVVEAVQFEKPLILLTFLADQGINARVLEEKKVGYPIPRDDSDGSFTRDSVAESLKLVMFEEGGKIYRDKIKEMKGMFCDEGRQDRYVENLLTFLQSYRSVKDDK
ncbi:UDP-glycosyltransferase 91A1-like [Coffea eugenioides]|uniref:UDP-glycosyltransferase 91A1-like n=1 Tax=Coffea eugenioides TaxID=49369 RepID=UPI000F61576A|nr:UDP-glycosyltransferase 91A1-like [Coffea eugenioides]